MNPFYPSSAQTWCRITNPTKQNSNPIPVIIVVSVGKVESGDVHPGEDELSEFFDGFCDGPDRADDARVACSRALRVDV